MLHNKENILQTILFNKTIIKNYGVKRIGLFGSYARDEQKKDSDIDFLVEFVKQKKTYKNFIHLNYYLQELFNSEIDLITIKSLPKDRNFTNEVLNQTIYVTL